MISSVRALVAIALVAVAVYTTPQASAAPESPASVSPSTAATPTADPAGTVTKYADLAYGSALPGNLLDLYVPDHPGGSKLPLLIWHSGSGWFANGVKDFGDDVAVVEEFTRRGYAVASINIRSSSDARFPAQGFDVRAAIRYLRETAATYGIDPDQIAFMGDSSGGWATAFAAATGDTLELPGETGVDGTSSAVQVAVAFFAPTDFLSMDAFATANGLPMSTDAYPHDGPTSAEGLLVHCPGEGPSNGEPDPDALVSIQACPEETEMADPTSYIDHIETPIWLLHGLGDPLVPYNQSQFVYDATAAAGNVARLTFVPGAGHSVDEIIGAPTSTTRVTDRIGIEGETEGAGPTWEDVDRYIRGHLASALVSEAGGTLPVLRLPGTRASPAGEYGWQGGPRSRRGMHKVNELEGREVAALTFGVGPDCLSVDDGLEPVPVRIAGFEGVSVEPLEPPVAFGGLDGDEITRAHALAVGDRTLCVFLTWHERTTPDELAAAAAILDSLRAVPIGESSIRITFTLDEGWDIG